MNMKLGSLFVSAALFASLATPAMAQVAPSYAVYPSQSYCPQLSYNLYRGLSDAYTGGQVSQLQYFLGTHFASKPVPVTGYYGSVTTAYVAQFQREQGLYPVTGGVGPLTRAAIARVCGGTTPTPQPGSSTFYLNTPFSLTAGTTAHEYQGQLDVTLSQITTSPYTLAIYPGYAQALSASVTLGQACAPGTYCFYYPQQSYQMTVGQSVTFQGYTVTLTALTASSATFTATKSSPVVGAMTVSSPTQGQTVQSGSQLTISWSAPYLVTSGSYVLDLYTSAGSKVGTIAIQSATSNSGSYVWSVPRVPNNYFCTMQYPNGLCGQNLEGGSYFVKVSLVPGNGFDNQTATASANSGTFTVTSASQSQSVSAYPQSGPAPLTTTFTVANLSGTYAVNFGDGTSATLQSGPVTHTYAARGTYTATFSSDFSCMYSNPRCMVATQSFGSVTVTAY